jgi:hypothetical protein
VCGMCSGATRSRTRSACGTRNLILDKYFAPVLDFPTYSTVRRSEVAGRATAPMRRRRPGQKQARIAAPRIRIRSTPGIQCCSGSP